MTRVKGFIPKAYIDAVRPTRTHPFDTYVEEIPQNAIRCEAVVRSYDYEQTFGELKIELPAALIGQTVSVIIIPKEEV